MGYSINERLKEIRNYYNLSQDDFAKEIYVSRSFFTQLENGKKKLNERIIELICNSRFNVNKNWLLSGDGEMFSNEAPPDIELLQLMETMKELDPLHRKFIIKQIKEFVNLYKESKEEKEDMPNNNRKKKKIIDI
jgi:transcriptional regulator with XRE-family HTH domain